MAYWYKGKRHTHKPIKRALKKIGRRIEAAIQGVHPQGGGGRDVEHYTAQALRGNATPTNEKESEEQPKGTTSS